jgi:DNA repair protein RecO (recombination protein O)
MDYKYHGLILGKRDLAETDRLYIIYTEESGKIRTIGKGVRKPNAKLAGNLEPVTFAEIFTVQGQGMGKIIGAIPIENFPKIKAEWELLERVLYVFRIVQKVISEEERDEKFFQLLLEYLQTMENLPEKEGKNKKSQAEIITLGFLVKFLDQMGYRLEVQKCVRCGIKLKPNNNFFSASRGGIICPLCSVKEQNKIGASVESIKLLRIFLKNSVKNFTKLQVSEKDLNNIRIIIKNMIDWGIGMTV